MLGLSSLPIDLMIKMIILLLAILHSSCLALALGLFEQSLLLPGLAHELLGLHKLYFSKLDLPVFLLLQDLHPLGVLGQLLLSLQPCLFLLELFLVQLLDLRFLVFGLAACSSSSADACCVQSLVSVLRVIAVFIMPILLFDSLRFQNLVLLHLQRLDLHLVGIGRRARAPATPSPPLLLLECCSLLFLAQL